MLPLLALLLLVVSVNAANSDEWRTRSIYQLITDRFAPATENAPCNTADRVYCGGTWQTIISKLDYIQGMGFDAVWISPVGLSLEGNTPYGYGYHGYWSADPTKINPHFGTSDDLKALSAALHARGMYLMVDLVLNNLVSESATISNAQLQADDNGTLLFKSPSDYHPICDIQWGNHTSEQHCWLATNVVPLMDLATETEAVANVFIDWVPGFVSEYSIDGFRLDASKHMGADFQNKFCGAANIFCTGEVAGDDQVYAGSYQGPNGIDSVGAFGMMYGFEAAFSGSKPSMNTLDYYLTQAATAYPDPTVIGIFLDNQDNPRFNSLTNDASLVYNAIVASFLYGGIPTVYYGLEQDIGDGSADPANREALWLYNDYSTTATPTYARIANLNKIRSYLNKAVPAFSKKVATISAIQSNDMAWSRPSALIVLTNRGASGTGTWSISNSSFAAGASVVDLLTCTKSTVDSKGALTVTWTTGQPFVFVTTVLASGGGFCGLTSNTTTTSRDLSSVSSTISSGVASSAEHSSSPASSVHSSASTGSGSVHVTSTGAVLKAEGTSTASHTGSSATPSTSACRRRQKRALTL